MRIALLPALLFLLMALSLSQLLGCAGGGQRISDKAQQGLNENQRGMRALNKGQHQQALVHFQRARQIAESVEDSDAIAANLINSATAYRLMGQSGKARQALKQVLDGKPLSYPQQRRIEASMQWTLMALDSGQLNEAAIELQRARQWCDSDCPAHARLLAMSAYLALAQGASNQALGQAQAAVKLQRRQDDQQGLADALRVLGLARLAQGQAAQALQPLGEALEIDKRLGLSTALVKDLMALARAHAAQGDNTRAQHHYQRAEQVARADGQHASVQQARQEAQQLRTAR